MYRVKNIFKMMGCGMTALTVLLLGCGGVNKESESGLAGSGTAAAPWQVTSAADLNRVSELMLIEAEASIYSDDYYKLMGDVDLGGNAFTPIGTGESPINYFNGQFDCDGKSISNLSITTTDRNYTGLFGYLASGGVVRACSLVNVRIDSSGDNVGAVAGYMAGALINTSVTGSVKGNNDVGGLVGLAVGAIEDSYSEAEVTGASRVGGLSGSCGVDVSNFQRVCTATNSYSSGMVTGVNDVGGLVGSLSGTVSSSYATGVASGSGTNVGGLVGFLSGTIRSAYATGLVSSSRINAGGLVGAVSDASASITNAYTIGMVFGDTNEGGFIGRVIAGTPTISGSYWDRIRTGQTAATGTSTSLVGVTDVDSTSLRNGSAFPGWESSPATWSFSRGCDPRLTSVIHPERQYASESTCPPLR
ncbi:hypothetical protein COTS27_00806 [Spirochaetota bacterium]|nr:hypothetical protein COTS27_00806 [Spirochaetota bacterium]